MLTGFAFTLSVMTRSLTGLYPRTALDVSLLTINATPAVLLPVSFPEYIIVLPSSSTVLNLPLYVERFLKLISDQSPRDLQLSKNTISFLSTHEQYSPVANMTHLYFLYKVFFELFLNHFLMLIPNPVAA